MSTENTKTHTDIKINSWLVAKMPEIFKPYALIARLDRPIGVWLLLIPCLWGITLAAGGVRVFTKQHYWLIALFFIGAIVMRSAGCVVNDIWDRRLDKKVERTRDRPLASGAISVKAAVVFLAGLLLAGLLVLLQMNVLTVMLGFLSMPLIIAYPLMKRITWWPQAFLGLTFNFGALMGWSAVTGDLSLPAYLLYLSGIFWTLGYDTIYAHQDMEDDMMAGIKSTALKFGRHSRIWVGGFYGVSLACLVAAIISVTHSYLSAAMFVPAALHLTAQLLLWEYGDAHNALRIFKSNRNYGLLVLLGIIAAGLL